MIESTTRVLVQGITGRHGSFHTGLMLEYGTNVVAGVTPGKGGEEVHGVPVFDTVEEAVDETGAEASVVFVPAPFAPDAVMEAIEAGLDPIVVITEHIPAHDTMMFVQLAEEYGVRIIGPNTPGIIVPPERTKMGIMPHQVFSEGSVAVASRSGTLTYEIVHHLTEAGIGQSVCVGLGGDTVVGMTFIDFLEMVEEDPDTEAVVLIGEIGGSAEEEAAEYIAETDYPKPVVAYIAGRHAPPGKRMGHAGAIVHRGQGTAESKEKAFLEAGVEVAKTPWEVPELLKEYL
ncbi:MAG: succinate--CoA ligase subunit alpha [Methanopyri archaeon]|nr:succinate--CoA ligase subunit alpha [Methanopyri archaeon]